MNRPLTRDRLIAVGLLTLIAAHLALGALEVLHRPIFPWDAWLNWMYRAKAWYLSGQMGDFDPVTLWASGGTPENAYAIAGNHYPRLLPLIGVTMASIWGSWNEPLINTTYIVLGMTIAVGIYVIARRHGQPAVIAIVCAYLTVSTPLIGAHLSLAGQADIWMVATTGLGFAALCSGLINRSKAVAVGLVLIALGALFKAEGALWLAMAAGLILVTVLGRRRVVVFGIAAVCLLGFAIASGVYGVNVPGLGKVGLIDGTAYVPLIGDYEVQSFDLGDDYLSNFFLGASWNLLWFVVIAASIVAALRVRHSREVAVFVSFLGLFVSSQILIFFFTEQGAWAEDWTAINRLPLQFTPALVFASICLLWPTSGRERSIEQQSWGIGEISASRAFFTGTITCFVIAVTLGSVAATWSALDSSGESEVRLFPASQLRVIQGRLAPYRSGMSVQRYDNNVAIVSTGRIALDADRYKVLRVSSEGSNQGQLTLFWRRAGETELRSRTLAGLGNLYASLDGEPAWRGVITEVGLVVYNDGGSARIEFMEFHPDSFAVRIAQFFADKLWVNPWSQKSVHWLPGGNPDSATPAPLVAIALIALATAAAALISKSSLAPTLAGACLGGWILLDSTWLYQRAALGRETLSTYKIADPGPLAFGDDRFSLRETQRATCDLAGNRAIETGVPRERLIVASNADKDMRFQLLRAKYHALPVAAHAHETNFDTLPVALADRILVLKLRYGVENARIWSSGEAARLIAEKAGQPVVIAWENDSAYLLLIGRDRQQHECWQQSPA